VPFRLDRTFVFAHPPEVVWDALSRPQDYPRWWSWLREIDASELAEGTTAHCLIRAPVPFALHLTLHVHEVVPHQRVAVRADGDLTGTGALQLAPHDTGGSMLRLTWALEPHRRLLGAIGLVSRPLLQWGQDWVVDTGVRQFRRRALPH
jgi:uncharacterized protein YndB with AHSA1/START domain